MRFSPRFKAIAAAGIGVAAILALTVTPSAASELSAITHHRTTKPTVVLVHGGFADASGWDGVIGELQHDGYPVLAVANPLRGLDADSSYVEGVIRGVPGPVVLVGHSYGGAVITKAATGVPNVKSLVYVAGFAPDKGETLGQLYAQFPNALLTQDALVPHSLSSNQEDAELSIAPDRFPAIFAADLPRSVAVNMAVRQRPVHASVFDTAMKEPAWKTIPSWYLVASQDRAIDPAAERFFAKRMHAHTVEVKASHSVLASQPRRTTALIESAAQNRH